MTVYLSDGYVLTPSVTTVVKVPTPVPYAPRVMVEEGYVTTLATTTIVGSDATGPVSPDGTASVAIPASGPTRPPPPYVPSTSGDVYRPGLSTV